MDKESFMESSDSSIRIINQMIGSTIEGFHTNTNQNIPPIIIEKYIIS